MKNDFSFILDIWARLGPMLPAPFVMGSKTPQPQVRNPCHSSLRNGIAAAQPPAHSVPDGAGAARRQPPCLMRGSILPIAKCSSFILVLGKTGRWKSLGGQVLLAVRTSVFAANRCGICQGSLARSHTASPFLLLPVLFWVRCSTRWKAPGDATKQHDPMQRWVPASSLPLRHHQLSAKLLSTDKSETPELI